MKNQRTEIMKFQKFLSKMNESLKETRLNQILDKVSKKIQLTKLENDFLDNYDSTTDEDIMDFKMLSKETTFVKINNLLERNKKVICNLTDRNGVIGIEIVKIFDNYRDDITIMTLKNGEKISLKDNMLYNILYKMDKDIYSLEMEDEFFEKIPLKK